MGCGGNCACAQRRAEAEAQMEAGETAVQSEAQAEEKGSCKRESGEACACKEA